MKKRNEIRIANLDETVFERIKALAKENKRTIAKQAEFMIEMAFVDDCLKPLKDKL
jgi:predicted urease superfamily metal-dependent hydrolase